VCPPYAAYFCFDFLLGAGGGEGALPGDEEGVAGKSGMLGSNILWRKPGGTVAVRTDRSARCSTRILSRKVFTSTSVP